MPRSRAKTTAAFIQRHALRWIDIATNKGMRAGGTPMRDFLTTYWPSMTTSQYQDLIGAWRQGRRAAAMIGPKTSGQVGLTAPVEAGLKKRYRYQVVMTTTIGGGVTRDFYSQIDSSTPLTQGDLMRAANALTEDWVQRSIGREERYRHTLPVSVESVEVRYVTQRGR